jgi:IS30 family transposase
MSQFSISGRVIGGQRAAIPSEPSRRRGDLSHTRHPRVIETLRQPRNHPPQQRKEGDLILGSNCRSAIATLVERQSRFTMLTHLPEGHGAIAVRDGLLAAIKTLPEHLAKSLTWDQGTELAQHRQITMATKMVIYFCDPHSPWQRGTNENTNGLLRQYFPKGTDLSVHSPQRLLDVAVELNDRPRKTLGGITPTQAMERLLSDPEKPFVAMNRPRFVAAPMRVPAPGGLAW